MIDLLVLLLFLLACCMYIYTFPPGRHFHGDGCGGGGILDDDDDDEHDDDDIAFLFSYTFRHASVGRIDLACMETVLSSYFQLRFYGMEGVVCWLEHLVSDMA